jgi:S-adenosylmethionine:tRNA ribosyltransferase-isomerase
MLPRVMLTSDFDFPLPPELIAQVPLPERDRSRMLVLDRGSGHIQHREFRHILEYIQPGDVLVLNNSRVIPARLRGANEKTGGRFEVLLVEENSSNDWWAMVRPGKRARIGTQISFLDEVGKPAGIQARVIATNEEGHRRLQFTGVANILDQLERLGEVPLPPYINRKDASYQTEDRQRYQTVFAEPAGSVAAPTAGLHFTTQLLQEIRARGTRVCFVTLHVGLGTFAPIKSERIEAHALHAERYELRQDTVDSIVEAKQNGHRVFAVGTTTIRVLETVAAKRAGTILAESGTTRSFIYPPYQFRIVDCLLTNFHLPRSTLLMLVSAFAAPNQSNGRDAILAAYAEAVRLRYRFFSYGDAMLIV